MKLFFSDSAFRHHFTEEEMTDAIESFYDLYIQGESKIYFYSFSQSGIPITVIGARRGDTLHVFHCNKTTKAELDLIN